MPAEQYVMGIFGEKQQAISAIKDLGTSPWRLLRVHSPFPDHELLAAMPSKKSRVGLFTLIGGIVGFFSGIALAVFTATRWHLIVSGKPVVALIPFLIVGFEFTILFAVLGNILGLFTLTRLPAMDGLEPYDERCSGEHFGVLAACDEGQEEALTGFFKEKGGEVKHVEPSQGNR